MKTSLLGFICILLSHFVTAQVWPMEGSKLNYRLIGFSFQADLQPDNYIIEIAKGYYYDEISFKKNVIKQEKIKDNKTIIEVPFFGCQYTWRYKYKKNNIKTASSDFHHFSTTSIPNIDTAFVRLRIVNEAQQYKDAYVIMDGSRVLYDLKGVPLWYLPDIDSFVAKDDVIRDLKHTSQGTITFLAGNQMGFKAYEINYDGKILWRAPDNGLVSHSNVEDYHHEFTRLNNGDYMVLGNEWLDVFLKVSNKRDSSLVLGSSNSLSLSDTLIKIDRKPFGTLIEYNKTGDVIWSYKSSSYFRTSDLFFRRDAEGKINVNVHDNAFFFDEKAKAIYISFKEIDRIIKIKYPEGIVLNSYGSIYRPGNDQLNNLFCGQHCCRRSNDGYLYLFNNNSCNAGENPRFTMLREPLSLNDTLKKVWEYECTNEGLTATQSINLSSVSGGSLFELPDRSLFGCMGNMHSMVLIVNKDKQVLWKAVPEIWDKNLQRWNLLAQYRADIIANRDELEQMIWKSEKQ